MNDRYAKEFREKYQPTETRPSVSCQCKNCRKIRGYVEDQGIGE